VGIEGMGKGEEGRGERRRATSRGCNKEQRSLSHVGRGSKNGPEELPKEFRVIPGKSRGKKLIRWNCKQKTLDVNF